MKFVFLVVLLAWGPDGTGTKDSGRFAEPTLSLCHQRSQAFSKLHGTPVQLCQRISERGWNIIQSVEVVFDFNGSPYETVEPDTDEQVERLLAALKAIGRLHVGKTRDSQKVRKIIREATK